MTTSADLILRGQEKLSMKPHRRDEPVPTHSPQVCVENRRRGHLGAPRLSYKKVDKLKLVSILQGLDDHMLLKADGR